MDGFRHSLAVLQEEFRQGLGRQPAWSMDVVRAERGVVEYVHRVSATGGIEACVLAQMVDNATVTAVGTVFAPGEQSKFSSSSLLATAVLDLTPGAPRQ